MKSTLKVFKFGGASVRDAKSVLNVVDLIKKYNNEQLVVVVSAMGKTTNKLESLFEAFKNKDKVCFLKEAQELKSFHLSICNDLFEGQELKNIETQIITYFDEIHQFMNDNKTDKTERFLYDQLIPYGELLSTKIIHSCLIRESVKSLWCDARTCIKTDSTHQSANVDWTTSLRQITTVMNKGFEKHRE